MASNPIPKIDENNEVIGVTTITEARENGWPRRVTRIFIFNEKDEVLLQKRSLESRIHPGVWDCSGGHVDVDESYTEAGAREVQEELGMEVSVKEVSDPVLFDNTFYVLCKAHVHSEVTFILKTDEVTKTKWVSVDELSQMTTMHPDSFTPWVVDAWTKLKDKLIQ